MFENSWYKIKHNSFNKVKGLSLLIKVEGKRIVMITFKYLINIYYHQFNEEVNFYSKMITRFVHTAKDLKNGLNKED